MNEIGQRKCKRSSASVDRVCNCANCEALHHLRESRLITSHWRKVVEWRIIRNATGTELAARDDTRPSRLMTSFPLHASHAPAASSSSSISLHTPPALQPYTTAGTTTDHYRPLRRMHAFTNERFRCAKSHLIPLSSEGHMSWQRFGQ